MNARDWSLRHAELLRRERGALAELLLSLAEFDRLALYRDLGFANLFDYLHRELRLSRGSAHYRQVATRLVSRFPEIVEPLRDGRLCLTTVIVLARVITDGNRHEVLPRFFGLSRQEAEQVAVEIRPADVVPRRTVLTELPDASPPDATAPSSTPVSAPTNVNKYSRSIVELAPSRTLVVPLTPRESRMHITVSPEFVRLLARAKAGQSHVRPWTTDEEVLTAGLELLVAQQEKRRASVPPRVKREVMKRDGGRCQWPVASGGVCGSTVRIEVDHVVPRGRGGSSTVENCRILCKSHNLEAARRAYGDELMDDFAPRRPTVRERCADYGYATKVRVAVMSAVAPRASKPFAAGPVSTTVKLPPTRSWKSEEDIAEESKLTVIGTGPTPVGPTTLATGYELFDPFGSKETRTVPVTTCSSADTRVEPAASRVNVAEVTTMRDGDFPRAWTAAFTNALYGLPESVLTFLSAWTWPLTTSLDLASREISTGAEYVTGSFDPQAMARTARRTVACRAVMAEPCHGGGQWESFSPGQA
jgi:5-methylcytosine-specific restriction endonuclease McrA